jgi:hypothetical protein
LLLGGTQLSAAGDITHHDIFIARLSGQGGDELAALRLGGTGEEFVGSISTGPSGEIVTTGQFAGFAEFGDDTLTCTGAGDGFLLVSAPP